jgi:hypothetical membrane protein
VSPRGSARAAAFAGLGAFGFALGVPLIGAALRPGYSHVSQYISELGESGAAGGTWVSLLGFAPTGLLALAFFALGSRHFPASRRSNAGLICLSAVGAAYLVTSVARCEPGCESTGSLSQSVHNLAGLFEYLGALVGLALLVPAFGGSPRWRALAPACALAALFVALGFAGMLTPPLASLRGVSQRIAEAAIFLWIARVSVFLLRADSGVAA